VPLILLLLLFLLLFIDKREELVDAEPSNTLVKPICKEGSGTRKDPFVLRSISGLAPGEKASSYERITFEGLTVESVELIDLNQEGNGNKFSMFKPDFSVAGTRTLDIDKNENITITLNFDDDKNTPTFEGGEYSGLLKIGKSSVYFSWTVTVKPDLDNKMEYETPSKPSHTTQTIGEEGLESNSDAKAAEEKAAAAAKKAEKKIELKRVQERSKSIDFGILGAAKASDKDDLQAIKGIGPFIEEKLNALGIFTYLQVSKMTSKLETDVNEAIEFFSGRIKRDQWANQARTLYQEKK
jgi:predicted flap endonuclease-1-like 5' DNA nuclease